MVEMHMSSNVYTPLYILSHSSTSPPLVVNIILRKLMQESS